MARTLAQINAEIEKLKKQAEELKSREVREVVAPRWPLQIPPPVATPNSPRQDGWIMRFRG
jgi:hypothetical protein